MSNITIRAATEKDFDGIWEILHRVVATGDTYSYSPDISKEQARRYWMPSENKAYVAILDNKVVGTYFLRPNHAGLASHVANGSYMVHPDHHRHGIGLLIAKHSIEEAKNLGYRAMQFNLVVSTNEPALTLWKKVGFKIIGTTPQGFKHATKGFVDTYILHRFV